MSRHLMSSLGLPFLCLPQLRRPSTRTLLLGGAAVATLGAGRWETIRSVTFPGALPYILNGVRSGLGFGWRALIAAELVGATTGLGQMIFRAADFSRTDVIVGGCLLIGVLAMAMDRWLLLPLERRTVQRWGLVTRSEGAAR